MATTSTTSQKHIKFVAAPMLDKLVDKVPGVSDVRMATTSTTSQKHIKFVATPMLDKLVDKVPGVSDVTAANLKKDHGIIYAYQLYGHFLIRTEDDFKEFLRHAGANAFIQTQACDALVEWKTNYHHLPMNLQDLIDSTLDFSVLILLQHCLTVYLLHMYMP